MLAEFDTDIVMEDGDDTGRGNIQIGEIYRQRKCYFYFFIRHFCPNSLMTPGVKDNNF